ncbi:MULTISPECIES: alanine/glycine:cation symporter family protein [Brucella]|uniref:Amino acid carrier protein n=1 Tax=Brucella ceti M644/93/1 TaxID=520459 RepID=A0ABM9Z8Y0_9HYPH|nr:MULTISPECIES: sodium:alanine symporter family protein [Brucella]AHB01004.1 Sodium:alanine symporter [Brucella ceti TE10759-12]EEX88765.1 amino acid carrier protein [Brucella ceti M13/05/1]EEX96164.1 amino acid carrier protein [Brucella ceti M644/93/1]ENR08469.1 amino acid carrier protein [Brucella sp. UK38/05]ENT08466.1 amino acid carrier protein [Brucella sp. F5/06]
MATIIDFLNNVFWNYVLVYGLLAVGLFFTIRLKFVQFVHFPELFRVVFAAGRRDEAGISPFQALTISIASRVGTGNITGVAVALYLGGPGAIFWMWIVALVGLATAYSESALAQLYKIRNQDGQHRGGPAFYIARGLGLPWAGALFSICLILSFGLVFNAVQANAIADSMVMAFNMPKLGTGIVLAILSGVVIFGGIRQIARVAEVVVPFMAFAYILMAICILAINFQAVPSTIALIFSSAFGLHEAVGGVTGGITAAMLNGVKRGLFSNEAGMGSAPNIAAVATPAPHHPSSQGFVQSLGVFIDTILVCTATAIMILLSGILEPGSGLTGTQLTQMAMTHHIGDVGVYFIAAAIFFFAFTSIIGNYSYAESAMTFLGLGGKVPITILRCALLAMVVWGAYESIHTVFDAADASMGLMATINLIAIVLLSGTVKKLTVDYFAQRRAGQVPTFHAADYPELQGQIDMEIWSEQNTTNK